MRKDYLFLQERHKTSLLTSKLLFNRNKKKVQDRERKKKEEKPVGGRLVGVVAAVGNCVKSHWPFQGAGANCPPKNGLRAESLLWLLS